MFCLSFCHFFGAPLIFLGQAWADGKGKLATCRHRADSGGETVKNVRRHSLDRLHASMNKQKKKMKPTRRPDEVRRKRIMKSPSFSRPAGRPGPDQAGTKKAGEPAGRGLAWTASRRPVQAKARTGPAGLLRPLVARSNVVS
jgi:hypothetical protein